jgi:multiple sugar transport system substrate-binding protein
MKFKHSPLLALFAILMLVLSACGGSTTPPAGDAPTAAPAAAPAGDAPTAAPAAAPAADAATAAPAAEAPTAAPAAEAPAPEPTQIMQFDQEAPAGAKVITWMVRSGPDENRWEKEVVLPGWQKAHPDIFLKVLNIVQDDIAVKREAIIAAKEPLDVWSPNWGGDGFASDRTRGLLADLTPLIDRDKFDTSDYIPEIFKIYSAEGKQYGIPFLSTGTYVYYNMKLFDEAKIPYPPTSWDDKSWTWDKFVALAKQLTKNPEDPNTGVYGAGAGDLWPKFDAVPLIFGKDPWSKESLETGFSGDLNITDDATINAFQKFHDLTYVDKVAPDDATGQALSQLGGQFQSGRVAMEMAGGWGHWSYKSLINDPNGFCWGAAPLPWGSPDANIRATIFTDPWAITAGLSQEQTDLGWEFIKFLAGPESSKAYTDATGAPPTRKSLLEGYYKQYEKCMAPDKVKEVFTGAFTHGRESSNHLLVGYNELSSTWDNALGPFWSDPEGKAADVLPQIQTDVNAALKRITEENKK